MGDRQVLLDSLTCSSMSHRGGQLALLLGVTAAVPADACVGTQKQGVLAN